MSPPTPLPWLPGAIIALLAGDASYPTLSPGGIAPAAPPDVTQPYTTVQVLSTLPIHAAAGAWSPLVQVDGWCSAAGWNDRQPEPVAWDMAALAVSVLLGARNVAYLTAHYTVERITDGPFVLLDKSRSESSPMWHGIVRAELRVHNP